MTLLHRVLFVAWRSPWTRRIHAVARLVELEDGAGWELSYVQGVREALNEGFCAFLEFPALDQVYLSHELFPLFQNRLMPRRRPDYREFIDRLALPSALEAPVPILARSGGRRETDKIEVFGFPSFEPARSVFVYLFFLRGVRHVSGAEERIATLTEGERLGLRPEPDNPVSSLAIVVDRRGGGALGWVPATLLGDLERVRSRGSSLRASVERRNPHPAPVHERLLCRLEATAVAGFEPFSGADYSPIAAAATPVRPTRTELVA